MAGHEDYAERVENADRDRLAKVGNLVNELQDTLSELDVALRFAGLPHRAEAIRTLGQNMLGGLSQDIFDVLGKPKEAGLASEELMSSIVEANHKA